MIKLIGVIYFLLVITSTAFGQDTLQGSLPAKVGLQECIQYALTHRGSLQQAFIDQDIAEREIASALSGWFPQIGASANYNYNIKIPTAVIGDNIIRMGQNNASAVVLQADQQILNPGLLQAAKAAKYVRKQADDNVELNKINVVVEVSKAYYDILTSEEQLKIIQENLLRLEKQLNDATARFETGMVDNTDYKRAQISLRNAKAEQKRIEEVLKYKYAYLKELMGLPIEQNFTLSFNDVSMEQHIFADTSEVINYHQRYEYRQLLTTKRLQNINTQYNQWSFLPNLSAFYNYAWDYRSNQFAELYDISFPRSIFGLNLSIPIFQGTKRIQEIRKSKLQEDRLDLDIINLEYRINTEYALAKATYNANIIEWKTSKDNVQLSEDVYNTIKLQYDEGIKTYLDLMTAEIDLRTSQINYLNALYALLSGKLDLQRALGTINTNY